MKIQNISEVEQIEMNKPDMEGLRIREIIDKEKAGSTRMTFEIGEIPPGKAHLMHRHPNAEQTMHVHEGSVQCNFEDRTERLDEGDVVFLEMGEWHEVRNDTDETAVLYVAYGGVGSLEDAGYELKDKSIKSHR